MTPTVDPLIMQHQTKAKTEVHVRPEKPDVKRLRPLDQVLAENTIPVPKKSPP